MALRNTVAINNVKLDSSQKFLVLSNVDLNLCSS
jgi:hypothetical protein